MGRVEEYISLREEGLQLYSHIKDYKNTAFSVTTAILAFSFSDFAQNEPFISMLPVIAIFPLYLLCEDSLAGIARIGAYLSVFFYDEGFRWSKRIADLDREDSLPDNKHILFKFLRKEAPFLSLIIMCGIITFIKCIYGNLTVQERNVRVFAICCIEIVSIVFMAKKHISVSAEKERLSEKWNEMVIKQKKDC